MSDHRRREYLAADGSLRRTLREIGLEGSDPRSANLTICRTLSADAVRPWGRAEVCRTAPAEPQTPVVATVLAPAVAK